MSNTLSGRFTRPKKWWQLLLAIPVGLILLPAIVPIAIMIGLGLACRLLFGLILYLIVWQRWCQHGPAVLLVYSDSPKWKEHIETFWLPRLPPSTHVLNSSERSQWPERSLPVVLFRHFAGRRDHTPIVIVFPKWAKARRFRFLSAFNARKHGAPAALASEEARLFGYLTKVGTAPPPL